MKSDSFVRACYFLGALGAWVRQLELEDCGLSKETLYLLKKGIYDALSELKAFIDG